MVFKMDHLKSKVKLRHMTGFRIYCTDGGRETRNLVIPRTMYHHHKPLKVAYYTFKVHILSILILT